jgi:putative addiction module component (TIGR02574 family)
MTFMTPTARDVLANALALTEEDRLDLAAELLASVDGPADPDWDTAWLAELDRRAEAAASGASTGTEWATVRARILERLARR